jgi:hypothetical protein
MAKSIYREHRAGNQNCVVSYKMLTNAAILERKTYVFNYNSFCWKWLKTRYMYQHATLFSASFGICCLHNYIIVKQKVITNLQLEAEQNFYENVWIRRASYCFINRFFFQINRYLFQSSPLTSKYDFASFAKISLKGDVYFPRK